MSMSRAGVEENRSAVVDLSVLLEGINDDFIYDFNVAASRLERDGSQPELPQCAAQQYQ